MKTSKFRKKTTNNKKSYISVCVAHIKLMLVCACVYRTLAPRIYVCMHYQASHVCMHYQACKVCKYILRLSLGLFHAHNMTETLEMAQPIVHSTRAALLHQARLTSVWSNPGPDNYYNILITDMSCHIRLASLLFGQILDIKIHGSLDIF